MSSNPKLAMRAKEFGDSAVAIIGHRRSWLIRGAVILAIVVGAGFLLRGRIQRLFTRNTNVAELQKDAKTTNAPEQWRALGHAEFAKHHLSAGVRAYERALSLDKSAADDQMRTNLVAAYRTKAQPAAERTVVRHKLVDLTPQLEKLIGERDYKVRWGAMRTLEKLGKMSKSDYKRVFLADLDSPECEVRRNATERLGEVGDQHVIPRLRLAKKKDHDATPWYKATCLGSRPDKAEKQILSKSKA